MSMAKIKKGDLVQAIAGKDKGRTGVVSRVLESNRAIVEGLNLVKKHRKGNPQKNVDGAIVDIEASIHMSNLALVNTVTNKADRVGIKCLEDGQKVRYYKSNGEVIS